MPTEDQKKPTQSQERLDAARRRTEESKERAKQELLEAKAKSKAAMSTMNDQSKAALRASGRGRARPPTPAHLPFPAEASRVRPTGALLPSLTRSGVLLPSLTRSGLLLPSLTRSGVLLPQAMMKPGRGKKAGARNE